LRTERSIRTPAPKEAKVARGFGGYQENGGRSAKTRVSDLVREKVEADVEAWYAVLVEAREAMHPVVVGNGSAARVEMHPDHGARLKAFQVAFDRGFGRPKQSVDVETTERRVHSFIDDPKMVEQSRALRHAAANARRN
jgi:hypothetical protein